MYDYEHFNMRGCDFGEVSSIIALEMWFGFRVIGRIRRIRRI